jgi:hypothetical protein
MENAIARRLQYAVTMLDKQYAALVMACFGKKLQQQRDNGRVAASRWFIK